jgi:hypothetical protein
MPVAAVVQVLQLAFLVLAGLVVAVMAGGATVIPVLETLAKSIQAVVVVVDREVAAPAVLEVPVLWLLDTPALYSSTLAALSMLPMVMLLIFLIRLGL